MSQVTDPVDLLLAYHARLRSQLEHLATIAACVARREDLSRQRARRLAQEVIAVLGNEGALHAVQEGDILLRRLRAKLGRGDFEVAQALRRMDREHEELGRMWPRVHAWLCLLDMPDAWIPDGPFNEACHALIARYTSHLDLEERTAFPAARAHFDKEEMDTLLMEMQASHDRVAPLLSAAP